MATTILTIPTAARHTPLALWHLLSLDAPTVAVLWTIFAARALHQALPPTLPVTMFLAVWLLYAADRLLDARPATTKVPRLPTQTSRGNPATACRPSLQPRHLFHRTHRTPFLIAITLATFVLAFLLSTLPRILLRPYLLLATLLAVWFALIHLTRISLPKEFLPGPFFAAAVFLPFHAGIAAPALLAALCTLNCLYIHHWEHPASAAVPDAPSRLLRLQPSPAAANASPDPKLPAPRLRHTPITTMVSSRATSRPHPAHPATRLALRHLPQLTLALAILPLFRPSPLTLAVTLAALGLLALHQYRHHLLPTTLRAAADLALLTPMLILPFLR